MKPPEPLQLVSVHTDKYCARAFLYELLRERRKNENISHRRMPTWRRHIAFVTASPSIYHGWYLIRVGNEYVGSIYLSINDEIGVHICNKHRRKDYAKKAVIALMERHPRKRYLANINPKNKSAAVLFKSQQFRLLQHTYELVK